MSEQSLSVLAIGARLFAICAAAAVALGVVNEITEPRIAAQRGGERARVIAELVTDGSPGETKPGEGAVETYAPVYAGDSLRGYVLSLAGSGYGGRLALLAYYAPDGTIRAARLVEDQETPGLGKKAEAAEYMAMFVGTGGEHPVPVSKEMLVGQGAGGRPTASPQSDGVAWARMSRPGLSGWLFGAPGGAGGGGAADAVTGATITFKGVSSALAEGARFVKGLGGR